jgi:hypothetical protein
MSEKNRGKQKTKQTQGRHEVDRTTLGLFRIRLPDKSPLQADGRQMESRCGFSSLHVDTMPKRGTFLPDHDKDAHRCT